MSDTKNEDVSLDPTSETKEIEIVEAAEVSTTSNEDTFDSLARELKGLRETITSAQEHKRPEGRRSEDAEKIEKMQSEVQALRTELDRKLAERTARKAEFDIEPTNGPSYTPKALESLMHVRAPEGSEIRELQRGNDELYIASTLLGKNPMKAGPVAAYTQAAHPALYNAITKSMNTSTNSGADGGDWIPTGFSDDLVRSVRLEARVAALFGRVNMPTNPYTLPVEGADAVAYTVAEATADNDSVTTAAWGLPSTPKAVVATFDASKVGVRVVTSTEVTEDSIIEIIPYIREKILRALSEAQEDGAINGDGAVDSLGDTDYAGTSLTAAYDGLRSHVAACEAAGTAARTAGTTISAANINAARSLMGKYGVSVNQLAIVCGLSSYNDMLELTEVQTLDKYGPAATILNGELARIYGIPVIVSEYISDNMDADGKADGGGGGKTQLLIVRRDGFRWGDRRGITLKSREVIESDQQTLVAMQRLDFQPMFATTEIVAASQVNITP